jgi:hypothetical protein
MATLTKAAIDRIRREGERRGMFGAKRQRVNRNRFSPWFAEEPFKTQQIFLRLGEYAEIGHKPLVLYGGAVGGGKTKALVMWAAEGVEHPEYSALLLRKRMVDMEKPGGILDTAHKMFRGSGAVWAAKKMQYQFPSGAVIQFGPGENLRDIQDRYQGPAFTRIGIDEAGLLQWNWINWLRTRIRKPEGLPVTSGMSLTANPLGVCHDDLVTRFGLTAKARESQPSKEWFGTDADLAASDYIATADTLFVPANLYDNPFLDHVEYEAQFADLPLEIRDALLRGRWDVNVPGVYFEESHFERVPGTAIPFFETFVRAIDLGVTGVGDACGTVLGGWDAETDLLYIRDRDHWLQGANDAKETIVGFSKNDPPGTVYVMDRDNVSVAVVQDLVKNYRFEEITDHGRATIHAREITARKGFPILFISTKGSKPERNSDFTHHAYAGKVRLADEEWADDYVAKMVRLKGAKGDVDEDWDVSGLLIKAAKMFGGRLREVVALGTVIESDLERSMRLEAERRKRAWEGIGIHE